MGEVQLRERVSRNVQSVMRQIHLLAPDAAGAIKTASEIRVPPPSKADGSEKKTDASDAMDIDTKTEDPAAKSGVQKLEKLKRAAVDRAVVRLIETATSEDNLAKMSPTWHPWL